MMWDVQPPVTRCSVRFCRTTVDLDNDPAALCDTCLEVTCDGCEHTCEAEHFPWTYMGFGVLCACGQPMTAQEVCPDDPKGAA